MVYQVCLVMCSSQQSSAVASAADLYISRRFQIDRIYAKNNFDSWFVLSGKHGLLLPSTLVEPYDLDLKLLSAAERDEWGRGVVKALCEQLPPGDISVEVRAEVSYYEPLRTPLLAFGFKEVALATGNASYIRYSRLSNRPDASIS